MENEAQLRALALMSQIEDDGTDEPELKPDWLDGLAQLWEKKKAQAGTSEKSSSTPKPFTPYDPIAEAVKQVPGLTYEEAKKEAGEYGF
jgi:hypothetical protein